MEISAATPAEQPRIESLLRWAFDVPDEGARRWVERGGLEHWKVARREEEALSCLLAVPTGHYFGGRVVPSRAVCAVATAPEARGEGIAGRLLTATLQDLAREGVAVASLFPSTRTLYRSVGFEPAGTYLRYHVPLRALTGLRDVS